MYKLSISNIGNVPAKKIKYEIANLEDFFKNNINPNYKSVEKIHTIQSIKNRLYGEINTLSSNQEYEGFLCKLGCGKESKPFTSKNDYSSTKIKMRLTYSDLINDRKFKEEQFISVHGKEKGLTSITLREE